MLFSEGEIVLCVVQHRCLSCRG